VPQLPETRRICTYLTPEQADQLIAAAAGEGQTVSAFIRRLIVTSLQSPSRPT
jgi:uncharacterized protein (DUF1778 family)